MPRRGENVYKRKDGAGKGAYHSRMGNISMSTPKTYKEVKEKKKELPERIKPRESKTPALILSAVELFEFWLESGISDQVRPTTYENYYRSMQIYVIPFFKRAGNERITEFSVTQFVKNNQGYCNSLRVIQKKNPYYL